MTEQEIKEFKERVAREIEVLKLRYIDGEELTERELRRLLNSFMYPDGISGKEKDWKGNYGGGY